MSDYRGLQVVHSELVRYMALRGDSVFETPRGTLDSARTTAYTCPSHLQHLKRRHDQPYCSCDTPHLFLGWFLSEHRLLCMASIHQLTMGDENESPGGMADASITTCESGWMTEDVESSPIPSLNSFSHSGLSAAV